jgi:hypothetical protein
MCTTPQFSLPKELGSRVKGPIVKGPKVPFGRGRRSSDKFIARKGAGQRGPIRLPVCGPLCRIFFRELGVLLAFADLTSVFPGTRGLLFRFPRGSKHSEHRGRVDDCLQREGEKNTDRHAGQTV